MTALLFLVLACAHSQSSIATPAAAASPAVGMAPSPYTADQIRDAMPVGTALVYRREEAGKEPFLDRMLVVAADAKQCTIADAVVDETGNVLSEEGTETNAWEDLRKHAEFPADGTTRTDDAVDVPAGHFDTWKYVVVDPNGGVTTFQFARELPGPPVWMEVRVGEEVPFKMELVSRTPAR